MSDRKQEEKIKFLTETFKCLITVFLALTGGLAFLNRVTYSDNNSPLKAFDNAILVMGSVFDVFLLIAIFVVWFEIDKQIQKL